MRRRHGLTVALTPLALGLAAVTAAAVPTWLAPENVSSAGVDGTDARVAMDPAGNSVAV